MIKYLYFLSILLIFNGCTILNENFLKKNDNLTTNNNIGNNNFIQKMTLIDQDFFSKKEIRKSSLTLNSEDINKFLSIHKKYDTIQVVYKNIVKNNDTISNYTLKGTDYLKLYKLLYINQPKLFYKNKYNLINDFLLEIHQYSNLDFKYIRKIMENENFKKINELKNILMNLQKKGM